jgi:hypothetical protein
MMYLYQWTFWLKVIQITQHEGPECPVWGRQEELALLGCLTEVAGNVGLNPEICRAFLKLCAIAFSGPGKLKKRHDLR